MLIDQRDSVRALRAVHGRFYLAKLTLGLGVIGPGLVGRTFINQLYQQRQVGLTLVKWVIIIDLEHASGCWQYGHEAGLLYFRLSKGHASSGRGCGQMRLLALDAFLDDLLAWSTWTAYL